MVTLWTPLDLWLANENICLTHNITLESSHSFSIPYVYAWAVLRLIQIPVEGSIHVLIIWKYSMGGFVRSGVWYDGTVLQNPRD